MKNFSLARVIHYPVCNGTCIHAGNKAVIGCPERRVEYLKLLKQGDVLGMAIIKQKPPERQKKHAWAKNKNSTPHRAEWEKAPRTRT